MTAPHQGFLHQSAWFINRTVSFLFLTSPLWLAGAGIILHPAAALGRKVHTMALSAEIEPADKKRITAAYNAVAAPTWKARRYLSSGQLFAQVALTVSSRQGAVDSTVKAIAAKTYPLAKDLYKP
ncbi:MAG: hypothetical protein ACAH80_16255 [Alphaproteobacteria bacterium]